MSTGRVSAAALVPAAGLGLRLGGGTPKALRLLGGEPLVVHAVRSLRAAAGVDTVVVAVPAAEVATVAGWFGDRALVVAGGASRQQSVAAALAALPGRYDVVLVHDAARPLVPPGLVEAVIDAVSAGAPAVVPGVVPVDTVKRVDTAGLVRETLPREQLRAVQTPQGFRHDVLEAAHAAAGTGTGTGDVAGATDDAGLVELIGVPVLVIPGDVRAAKITSAADLALAEWALASSAGPA